MSRKGVYKAICDVCGFEYFNYQLQKRWDGLMVCPEDFEIRHPQDFIKIRPDTTKLPWTRPEPTDVEVDVVSLLAEDDTQLFTEDDQVIIVEHTVDPELLDCPPLGIYATAGIAVAGCAVAGNPLPGAL